MTYEQEREEFFRASGPALREFLSGFRKDLDMKVALFGGLGIQHYLMNNGEESYRISKDYDLVLFYKNGNGKFVHDPKKAKNQSLDDILENPMTVKESLRRIGYDPLLITVYREDEPQIYGVDVDHPKIKQILGDSLLIESITPIQKFLPKNYCFVLDEVAKEYKDKYIGRKIYIADLEVLLIGKFSKITKPNLSWFDLSISLWPTGFSTAFTTLTDILYLTDVVDEDRVKNSVYPMYVKLYENFLSKYQDKERLEREKRRIKTFLDAYEERIRQEIERYKIDEEVSNRTFRFYNELERVVEKIESIVRS